MRNIIRIALCLVALINFIACSSQPSTKKVRDVKDFSFQISEAFFATESGNKTIVTSQDIQKQTMKNGKDETSTVKLNTEQITQLKQALDCLPLENLKPKYVNEKVKDGSGITFSFKLDGKSYEVSYINHPLDANLKELIHILNKITPKEAIHYSW